MQVGNKEVRIELNGRFYHCAMDVTMHFIGGKWKSVALRYLRKDKKRFSQLRRLMPQMTERMLSIQLKQLEKDGIIKRVVFNTKPPLKVEYALTDFGKTLIPVLNAIAKWGRTVSQKQGKFIVQPAVITKQKSSTEPSSLKGSR